jgi:hypothetical protein
MFMSTHPSQSSGPSSCQQADHTAYYRSILHSLIDMGADLARMAHQQAKSRAEAGPQTPAQRPDAAVSPRDPILAFDRVAGTIRRCIDQARGLDAPVAAARARIAARRPVMVEIAQIEADQDAQAQAQAQAEHRESHRPENLRHRPEKPDLRDRAAIIGRDREKIAKTRYLERLHAQKRRAQAEAASLASAQPQPGQPIMRNPQDRPGNSARPPAAGPPEHPLRSR